MWTFRFYTTTIPHLYPYLSRNEHFQKLRKVQKLNRTDPTQEQTSLVKQHGWASADRIWWALCLRVYQCLYVNETHLEKTKINVHHINICISSENLTRTVFVFLCDDENVNNTFICVEDEWKSCMFGSSKWWRDCHCRESPCAARSFITCRKSGRLMSDWQSLHRNTDRSFSLVAVCVWSYNVCTGEYEGSRSRRSSAVWRLVGRSWRNRKLLGLKVHLVWAVLHTSTPLTKQWTSFCP